MKTVKKNSLKSPNATTGAISRIHTTFWSTQASVADRRPSPGARGSGRAGATVASLMSCFPHRPEAPTRRLHGRGGVRR